ncbi:chitin deacetylase [Coprinopsis cinerea okayama7|uniref:Chitin deacetylase n=1 Tax=Coprinopsis cinerea (strain Okayama-7 / 130 / ATCC MYA-4618 / FGSC 9003) TaxID=240176 RepID=D6RNZ0_COPC7|nr:chitin deacetylase [Coprinopsis cinerea okayama7\|eukprot:XP_002910947.1 chitin deacetylase [Coprinopsis cinerea okayama7\
MLYYFRSPLFISLALTGVAVAQFEFPCPPVLPSYPEYPFGCVVGTCSVPNTVAITFNGGPSQFTSSVVDILNKHNMKATFFVTGKKDGQCIYDYADAVIKADDAGHQIGSYTWGHLNLTDSTRDEILEDDAKFRDAMRKILGKRFRWMRPPYGALNRDVRETLVSRGIRYKIAHWSHDTQDESLSVEAIKAKFNELPDDPMVVVMANDWIKSTAEELMPWIVEWVQKRGLRAVTLSECTGEAIPGSMYDWAINGPTPRDETWVCD